MVSGMVGEKSHLALGFHGESRVAARVFLMAGLRDTHLERRSVTYPPILLRPGFFFQILDHAESEPLQLPSVGKQPLVPATPPSSDNEAN